MADLCGLFPKFEAEIGAGVCHWDTNICSLLVIVSRRVSGP